MQTYFSYDMNILITGSCGQLGSEIRTLCSKKAEQHHFIFTDVDTLDICDETAVSDFFAAHKIDLVVNCATYTAVYSFGLYIMQDIISSIFNSFKIFFYGRYNMLLHIFIQLIKHW